MNQIFIDHIMKKIKDSSPIIAFCQPEIVFVSNQMCQVIIPLIRETKSHIGSMGFGALSVGADFTGGLLVIVNTQQYPTPPTFVFSNATIDFKRKATENVTFTCYDGDLIAQTIHEAYQSKKGQHTLISIIAEAAFNDRKKKVAAFNLNLFIQFNNE